MASEVDDGQAWERAVGAASLPLLPGYVPRSPESTVLHRVVREHLATFLDEARARSAHGVGLPGFVEREFRDYLGCGVLARGFARVVDAVLPVTPSKCPSIFTSSPPTGGSRTT